MDLQFIPYEPQPEDYWRGIVLFGRNVATYKFALAKALLELKPESGQLLKLEELAVPFAGHLCEHLRHTDKQGTFQSSRFLDVCRRANSGEIDNGELVEQTVRLGFNNVIDAFHVVGRQVVPDRFFVDERGSAGGITITDAFSHLLAREQATNLPDETEARWRLVETAWDLGLTPSLLEVNREPESESLFVVDSRRRRRSITGAREALSGYQKGHCFYCYRPISLTGPVRPDVDHFFPHALKPVVGSMIDGVWNLALACQECNRGSGGKFDSVPSLRLLQRLHTRNEFLIASHHPLRETLRKQTGMTVEARRSHLNRFHQVARGSLLHEWETEEVTSPPF